jgi:hypothetical protein
MTQKQDLAGMIPWSIELCSVRALRREDGQSASGQPACTRHHGQPWARADICSASIASAKYRLETTPAGQAAQRKACHNAMDAVRVDIVNWAATYNLTDRKEQRSRIQVALSGYEQITSRRFEMFDDGESRDKPDEYQRVRDAVGTAWVGLKGLTTRIVDAALARLQTESVRSPVGQ